MALYEDRESNENKCPYLKANRANLVKFSRNRFNVGQQSFCQTTEMNRTSVCDNLRYGSDV